MLMPPPPPPHHSLKMLFYKSNTGGHREKESSSPPLFASVMEKNVIDWLCEVYYDTMVEIRNMFNFHFLLVLKLSKGPKSDP
jgi:hypothetical protein